MPLIMADSVAKGYGGTPLFEDVTFQVEAGDKIALVGPNGAGKSTLLRLLAGREKADHGNFRSLPVRSHWFDQHPDIPKGATVRTLLTATKAVPPAMQKEKDELEARIGDPALYENPGYEAVLERYAELDREIVLATAAGPAESSVMAQLGVLDLDQPAASLSGGEKTRVFLARTLQAVKSGDLVVLDEPTNHLDVDSIEWLEDWIREFDGTVLLVAHDRAFLDNVATRVFEIAHSKVTCYLGNYEEYIIARDENIEREKREHAKAEERVAGVKATVLQFRKQMRFDGQYASRMKALEKYQAALDKTPDPLLEKMGFGLAFGAIQKTSNEMMRLTGITKGYDDQLVLKGVDLELNKGARLGLVGANGAGKSTLLRILTGGAQKDTGIIHVAPGVKGAFFSQEHDDLDVNRTLHEEVLDARPKLEERDVKALLGRFRFNPEHDLRRPVSSLSGGERQRMMLLKCVLKPSNLLILDEPTNHLDLWARDVVISALNSYHGTIIVVSHDRFLLDSVTETTAVLDDGILHHYTGTFTETRDLHGKKLAVKSGSGVRVVVRKKFADWANNKKYAKDLEFETSEAEIQNSMTLRNALSQGWLERI